MKPMTKTLFLAAVLAGMLVVAAPTQSQACDFLHRLFCWCRRPAPVVVEPVVTPSYSYYLAEEYRTEVYYPSSDCRTEVYYPSSDCATPIELGSEPPPAPPAEDYLGTPPERTFEEGAEQSRQKLVEPDEAAADEGAEPTEGGAAPADPDGTGQPSSSGSDGLDPSATGSPQSLWQPMSRGAARALLSQRTRSRASLRLRNGASYVRASHPGWVPVENAPTKRLAAK